MKLQKQFLQNRRSALEAYLQQLLGMPDVCRSREFRSFLSQQAISQPAKAGTQNGANTQDMVTRIYNSVTDGMDEFLGNIAVIDQLSVAGQNLISAATNQMSAQTVPGAASTNKSLSENIMIEPGSIAEAEAELRAFEDKELTPFVKPICDIFLELFELNRGNNWLRGRAVVVVIHQLLGGTVERKIRDACTSLVSEEFLLRYIDIAKNTMWPTVNGNVGTKDNGDEQRTMRSAGPPRSKAQKDESKREAELMLNVLIPDLAGSVVGRANAQSAARRLAAVLNNRRLNEHLVHMILDEIIDTLFDDKGATTMAKPTRSARSRTHSKRNNH